MLMENLSFNRRNLNLIPLAFIINNIETLVASKYCEAMYQYTDFTFTSMGFGLLLISLLVTLLFYFAENFRSGKYFIHFNAGLLVSLAVVSIYPHIYYSIALGQYIPGLVTSVLLLPFIWLIFKKEIKPNLFSAGVKKSLITLSLPLLVIYAASMYLSLLAVNAIFYK